MTKFIENYDRFGRKSDTFYRLARKDKSDGTYDIYDFHTVVNGNMWYQYHERAVLSSEGNTVGSCYHGHQTRIYADDNERKEKANKFYRELQSKGYKCIGVFEEDICGVSRRIR